VLRLRQEVQVEEHWVREDGAAFDLILNKFPLVDTTGHCWGLGTLVTDITERVQAERALVQSQKLESLGVLAGGIAHDFNNLLGAMQGNVELAMTEVSQERSLPYLQTLKGLMAKASGLLTQMLAYAGQGKSRVGTLDLNQLVGEMTHLLGTSISKKARMVLELHPELPPMAGDPSQIQQVIMNLVLNASEAMGDQSGVITLATHPERLSKAAIDTGYPGQPLQPGLHVALVVSDRGAGMTPEVLKKIFDPFFTTKFTGRGLGLAAILGIVRGHQGGIQVSSVPGRGSRFKLLFPAVRDPVQPAPAEAPQPQVPAGLEHEGGAVLVVDDEDEMRAVAVLALERAGLSTLQARDGLQALDLVQRNPDRIRVILMDLTMPNMDGEEACRELRRRGPRMAIILTSGFNETEALSRFEGVGLSGFLQKPFGLGALVERVRKAWSG
jgi:signal transduction histidine kinase/CheY-like chemotaxis protein